MTSNNQEVKPGKFSGCTCDICLNGPTSSDVVKKDDGNIEFTMTLCKKECDARLVEFASGLAKFVNGLEFTVKEKNLDNGNPVEKLPEIIRLSEIRASYWHK